MKQIYPRQPLSQHLANYNYKPQQKIVGWPRCYDLQRKTKTSWWQTIRSFLF